MLDHTFELEDTSQQCQCLFSQQEQALSFKDLQNARIMSGFGLRRDASCDQKRGIDPRIWTTEDTSHRDIPDSSFVMICSVSTSFATLPLSFTPLLRYLDPHVKASKISYLTILTKCIYKAYEFTWSGYLVPAKWRDLRAIRVMAKTRPKIDILTYNMSKTLLRYASTKY